MIFVCFCHTFPANQPWPPYPPLVATLGVPGPHFEKHWLRLGTSDFRSLLREIYLRDVFWVISAPGEGGGGGGGCDQSNYVFLCGGSYNVESLALCIFTHHLLNRYPFWQTRTSFVVRTNELPCHDRLVCLFSLLSPWRMFFSVLFCRCGRVPGHPWSLPRRDLYKHRGIVRVQVPRRTQVQRNQPEMRRWVEEDL